MPEGMLEPLCLQCSEKERVCTDLPLQLDEHLWHLQRVATAAPPRPAVTADALQQLERSAAPSRRTQTSDALGVNMCLHQLRRGVAQQPHLPQPPLLQPSEAISAAEDEELARCLFVQTTVRVIQLHRCSICCGGLSGTESPGKSCVKARATVPPTATNFSRRA